mmetsp:Transcript_36332/g.86261  ORF Transcript_36332/g.86261 Transcript_36332/m.86261 type:complete len:360 (+) Transcript_36332:728-1807(+)
MLWLLFRPTCLYIFRATEVRKGWSDRLAVLATEVEEQRRVVEQLRAAKEAVEAEEERIREEKRLSEEAARADSGRDENATETGEEAEDAAAGIPDEGLEEGLEEGYYDGTHDDYFEEGYDWNDEAYEAEAAEAAADTDDPDEIGRRVAARWTSDPDATGAGAGDQDEGVDVDEGYDPDGYSEGEHDGAAGDDATTEEGNRIRTEFHDADSKLRSLEKEQSDLTSKLAGKYGDDGVWTSLRDQCFSAHVDKYVYEVCIFGEAKQKEGHSSVSLGRWNGELNGSELMYTEGQGCWQGPKRSLRVRLACGAAEELSSVEEPSRCEYSALLRTPAACSQQDMELSRAKLSELKAELNKLHDEL